MDTNKQTLAKLKAENIKLTAERDILRAALNKIASWSEGAEVNASFDEPGSAEIARTALAASTKA